MVELIDETNNLSSLDLDKIEASFTAYMHLLDLSQEVTVVLCNDDFIRERNLADRGLDEATDVLSYPSHEPDDVNMPIIPHLGDIFISLDTAANQMGEHNHDLLQEVLTLAAHGLTHLRGYDHPTEEAWQDFHEAQRQILLLHGDS